MSDKDCPLCGGTGIEVTYSAMDTHNWPCSRGCPVPRWLAELKPKLMKPGQKVRD